jgi:hypothetical protein
MMMRAHIPRLAVLVIVLLLGSLVLTRAQLFDSIDTVIFYPTYGVQDAGTRLWKVRMRAKVQESRSIAERFSRFVRDMPRRSAEEEHHFRDRMRDLVADDKSGEDVEFQFDGDASQKEYRIEKGNGRFPDTNGDGIVDGALRLADSDAQRLLAAQKSTNGWLTYHVTSHGHEGAGRLRLIGPTGLSVISDIDDTIKVTEVPAGKTEVILNTFYRDFVAALEMSKKYRDFGDAAFHYVSGGPWQLYRPVSKFLIDEGGLFPAGSFHMKDLSGNIRKPIKSLESLEKFVATGGTFDHKVEQITTIMGDFPGRTFILIGDSGECDPEVYRKVKSIAVLAPKIQEIIIRDVVNARTRAPHRLDGMTPLPATTVVDGGPPPDCGSRSGSR